ncbi:MAG: calcium-binding protein [Chloroflexi bacterium]|nr:calcium-binding protein [Chloroflexota bacterium]
MRGDRHVREAKEDKVREERIANEAIVDAYGPEEQAMGWYYYLEDNISFPFTGKCINVRHTSPLKVGQEINVVKMAPEDDCMHEMFVEVRWSGTKLAVPLSQIEPIAVDNDTREAIKDWHYGYRGGANLPKSFGSWS